MRSLRCLNLIVVVCLGLWRPLAEASSFESQQTNTAIFDGILGASGELIIDTSQSQHQWIDVKNSEEKEGFAYRKFSGDFQLTTHFETNSPAFAYGLQISNATSRTVADKLFRCSLDNQKQLRVDTKLPALAKGESKSSPDVFRLERKANLLILSVARFGNTLEEVGRWDLGAYSDIYVGAYRQFTKADQSVLKLKNWRWVIPVWPNFVPYREYIGSRLEILDTHTGERRVVYETPAGIEAPNWTKDGEHIIYDAGGRVYRLHLPTKKVALINTGFAVKNNNDHVVAYQNKFIGLTHLDKEGSENWTIYKLPFTGGGEPLQLTHKSPAYLHSWSPDGTKILFTALRNGQFDIFQTTTDGTDNEIQLTNTPELDDGPEYSPDGKFVYFNRANTKGMHIWRMDADGKNPKQLTNDELRDWFPHASPDGQSLVFMSYQPDVAPDQHPYYRPIYIRQLNLRTGKIKVLAYVYGGQGTINVPSWSSDSRYVAFVTNSQLGTQIKH